MGEQDKEVSAMNVVPLIDIMLVLLTIVLFTSTFIATGKIPVELPKANSAQKIKDNNVELIEIDSHEKIYVQEKGASMEVSIDQLKAHLETLSANAQNTQIILRADKNILLNTFVTVMDIVRENGFENLNLQAGVNVR